MVESGVSLSLDRGGRGDGMRSAISVIVVGGVGAAQPLLSYLSLDWDLDVQTNTNSLHQLIVCPSIIDPNVGVGRSSFLAAGIGSFYPILTRVVLAIPEHRHGVEQ